MKILFVWPNKDQFGFKPLGISLLSALCKEKKHETRLFDTTFIDMGYEDNTHNKEKICIYKPIDFSDYSIEKMRVSLKQEFITTLTNYHPDIVSYSALTDEYQIALQMSRITKEFDPAIINIVGSKYATICPENVINEPSVDFVCVGEGVEAFPELIKNIDKGEPTNKIRNIWTKEKGTIIRNPVRPLLQNLDILPYVDWDIFDDRQFLKPFDGKIYRGGDWMSNWGCPNKCSYCINDYLHGLYGLKGYLRAYSVDRAIDELCFLKKKYSLEFLKFHDEDFLLRNINYLTHFAERYENEVGLPFVIETSPMSTNEEKVKILKKMGCASVSLGVECGNAEYRKTVLNRRDKITEIFSAYSLFNKYHIRNSSFNLMGLPYETRELIFDTIELNRNANVMVPNVGFFFPFEGTKLRELCINEKFYDPNSPHIYAHGVPALTLPGISREELVGLHKTFVLYCKLPRFLFPIIERAERNDEIGNEIFSYLADIYKKYVMESSGFFPNTMT